MFLKNPYSADEDWRNEWRNSDTNNAEIIEDPNNIIPGFELPRRTWCNINRIRTGHGRCNYLLHKWNIIPSPLCACGAEETISHIVSDCVITKFQVDIKEIHNITTKAHCWIPLKICSSYIL